MGLLKIGSFYKKNKNQKKPAVEPPAPVSVPSLPTLSLDTPIKKEEEEQITAGSGGLFDDILAELNSPTAATQKTDGLDDFSLALALSQQLEIKEEKKPTKPVQEKKAQTEPPSFLTGDSIYSSYLKHFPEKNEPRETSMFSSMMNDSFGQSSSTPTPSTSTPTLKNHSTTLKVLDSDVSDSDDSKKEEEEEEEEARMTRGMRPIMERRTNEHRLKRKVDSWTHRIDPEANRVESSEAMIERMKDRHRTQVKFAAMQRQQDMQNMMMMNMVPQPYLPNNMIMDPPYNGFSAPKPQFPQDFHPIQSQEYPHQDYPRDYHLQQPSREHHVQQQPSREYPVQQQLTRDYPVQQQARDYPVQQQQREHPEKQSKDHIEKQSRDHPEKQKEHNVPQEYPIQPKEQHAAHPEKHTREHTREQKSRSTQSNDSNTSLPTTRAGSIQSSLSSVCTREEKKEEEDGADADIESDDDESYKAVQRKKSSQSKNPPIQTMRSSRSTPNLKKKKRTGSIRRNSQENTSTTPSSNSDYPMTPPVPQQQQYHQPIRHMKSEPELINSRKRQQMQTHQQQLQFEWDRMQAYQREQQLKMMQQQQYMSMYPVMYYNQPMMMPPTNNNNSNPRMSHSYSFHTTR
ncbi:unnamed protein product [Rhizopus stolonifer]